MNSCLTTEQTTTGFDVFADSERRYLISTLYERDEPLTVEFLATEVTTRTHDSPIVTTDQSRRTHIELVHRHVPKLLEVGLLREVTDGDARTVALADHPIFEAEWVTRLLENPTGGPEVDEPLLDRTLETLRPARRRLVCDILSRHDELAVADLAALVAAREDDRRLVDLAESDWQPIETTLVHAQLPALADADLVDYDRSSRTVSIAADAPQWRAEWLAASPLGAIAARLGPSRKRAGNGATRSNVVSSGTDLGTCWTIEGREHVIARGHEIADSAEEELFVTIPDAGMLQPRCLDRWHAAADRGVDIYVGSCSADVRETVGAAIPDATICEPQFDWLNFPVGGMHHGRVVFADRERVMLVTVDDANGEVRATAITGDGAENTLVTLVREHVCPRLERLQSRRDDDDDHDEQTPLPL